MRFLPVFVTVVVLGGCSIFEDPTPRQVSFQMTGQPGDSVQAIYSSDFLAGVDELGGTRVQVFGRDTVWQALPIDTVFDISASSQWFVQVASADTIEVSVRVEVDERTLVDSQGGIFPDDPWRYVYQFNQFLGAVTEVIF